MVESLYSFLDTIGFGHPLHPMLTHIPMGMIIGMVLFSLLGLMWKNSTLNQTAYHCSVLALVFVLPVIGAGVLDWLQFQGGVERVYHYKNGTRRGSHCIARIFSCLENQRGNTRQIIPDVSALPGMCRRFRIFRR